MTPRQRFVAARVAYVAIVLLATLSRLELSPDLGAAGTRLARALTPALAWRDAIDALRNAVLFAGLGAVWAVTSLSGRVTAEIRAATLTGLALGVVIEGVQAFSPVRTASLVDVATNTLGALGGVLGVVWLLGAVRRGYGARSYLGVPVWLVAGAYGTAVLCEAVTPLFRSEPLPRISGGPLARLDLALDLAWPLALAEVPWLDAPLYAPAAFLVVLYLGERGRDTARAWPLVAAVTALLAGAIEILHGALGIPVRFEAAAVHAVALTAGAWAAGRWLPALTHAYRGAARARRAIGAYAVVLVLWAWRPLLPEPDLARIAEQLTWSRFMPLASLAERVDVFSALHVAQQGCLYVPLGALLAVWPLRLRGRWSHLWPAVALALVLELGHVAIVDRYFDLTNVLLAAAGLALGWLAVRRCGFAPYGAAW
jgi:VanZ family protein